MPECLDPQQLAAAKRQARARRIYDLRMRVAAVAVALFLAAWGGLYVQLVSGNDPALAGDIAPTAQSADPTAVGDDSSDDGWSDGESGDGWSDDSSDDDAWSDATTDEGSASNDSTQAAAASQPAAVTSGQS
jgi:hypothetical protein